MITNDHMDFLSIETDPQSIIRISQAASHVIRARPHPSQVLPGAFAEQEIFCGFHKPASRCCHCSEKKVRKRLQASQSVSLKSQISHTREHTHLLAGASCKGDRQRWEHRHHAGAEGDRDIGHTLKRLQLRRHHRQRASRFQTHQRCTDTEMETSIQRSYGNWAHGRYRSVLARRTPG